MTTKFKILIALAIMLIMAMFTNPNETRHKETVKAKVNAQLQAEIKAENAAENMFGALLGGVFIDGLVNQMVTADNYLIFSTTKVLWKGEKQTIGIGVFGNVFISNDFLKSLDKGLLNEN